jgi:hypothetical protein
MEKYMGLMPQLEVNHDIALDQVEKILVPEHLWETEAVVAARQHPQLGPLMQKVEGTGKSEQEFLLGRNQVGRRPRMFGGHHTPHMGYSSLFKMEKDYFKLVLGDNYKETATALFEKYGYLGFERGIWHQAHPKSADLIERKEHDWKIFVNPTEESFLAVLEATLQVLQNIKPGVSFKIPIDRSTEWKGRPILKASNTPKIVIWVNPEIIKDLLCILEEQYKVAELNHAGFADQPGPSFAGHFGSENNLLFHKKEYEYGPEGDVRTSIAKSAEQEARARGITDENELMRIKAEALSAAGFVGPFFYIKAGEYDPTKTILNK